MDILLFAVLRLALSHSSISFRASPCGERKHVWTRENCICLRTDDSTEEVGTAGMVFPTIFKGKSAPPSLYVRTNVDVHLLSIFPHHLYVTTLENQTLSFVVAFVFRPFVSGLWPRTCIATRRQCPRTLHAAFDTDIIDETIVFHSVSRAVRQPEELWKRR